MSVEVSTPDELVAAVEDGALDIIVTNHLDLTVLPLKETGVCPDGCESPLGTIADTRSIRGNCADASIEDLPDIPSPDFEPLLPGQCILLAQEDMLSIMAPQIWLDNLYLRALYVNGNQGVSREDAFISLTAMPPVNGSEPGTAARYMTRMTFQGDNAGPTMGVFGDEKAYVEDSTFLHLGGSQTGGCPDCSSAVNSRATAVSLSACTFKSPFVAVGSRYILANEAGVVRVENCTFADADPIENPFEARAGSEIYSDDPTLQVESRNQQIIAPTPLEDIPEQAAGELPLFLSRDDQWFAQLRNELTGEPLPPPAVDAESPSGSSLVEEGLVIDEQGLPASTPSPSSSKDQLLPAILGAVGALVVVALVAVLAIALMKRRKRNEEPSVESAKVPASLRVQSASSQQQSLGAAAPSTGTVSSLPIDNLSVGGKRNWERLSGQQNSQDPGPEQSNIRPSTYATLDTFAATVDPGVPSAMESIHSHGSPGLEPEPPGKGAPLEDRLEFLHSQLDSFGNTKPIMKRFMLLGHGHRRQGGQGLVAFARGVHDQLDYAIKFFLVQESFQAERSLYETKALGALLPQVEAEYDPQQAGTKLLDARGTPLPPFLVMEKGESLSDWTARAQPDLFQGIAVLVHVAMRLRDMHAAGYVHRDVKPGNIMLLPRKNSWTVIDFGCTARTGEPAPLSFTVQYAPPEVIGAHQAGEKSIVATEAMDAWAMGVVAFELLTGVSAFSYVNGSKQIMKQLQGAEGAELPWEGDKNIDARRKLGIFRQPILSLLKREPSERATLAAFCSSCQQTFASTSTASGRLPSKPLVMPSTPT